MIESLMQLDREIFLFLNGLHVSWLDQAMFLISDKYLWIPLYLLLLWQMIKHYGWKTVLILCFVIFLITLSDQLTGFMKSYFQRLRPSHDESLEGLVHSVNEYRGGRYGFVSSHAASTFALAVFMIRLLGRQVTYIAPVMLTYAILNTYSRIYLGVHYPGDVLAGAIIGIILSLLVWKLYDYTSQKVYKTAGSQAASTGKG